MKKLMIFLLCFLLTGCAAPQAGIDIRIVLRLGLLPPGGGRVLSDARPGRLPGGEPLSL